MDDGRADYRGIPIGIPTAKLSAVEQKGHPMRMPFVPYSLWTALPYFAIPSFFAIASIRSITRLL
jgi:hypothetical protein